MNSKTIPQISDHFLEDAMKKLIFIAFVASAIAHPAMAQNTYNANIIAERVSSVMTYTNDGNILFSIPNMPTVPQCAGTFFIIPSTVPSDIRQQVLSRLLVAYSSKESVNIGFDMQTCDTGGNIVAFRVG